MPIKDAALSVVRHLLTIGGSLLASNGVLEASQVDVLAGALVTIAAVVWGIFDKSDRPA